LLLCLAYVLKKYSQKEKQVQLFLIETRICCSWKSASLVALFIEQFVPQKAARPDQLLQVAETAEPIVDPKREAADHVIEPR
jgi:hypothetical protein